MRRFGCQRRRFRLAQRGRLAVLDLKIGSGQIGPDGCVSVNPVRIRGTALAQEFPLDPRRAKRLLKKIQAASITGRLPGHWQHPRLSQSWKYTEIVTPRQFVELWGKSIR